RSQIGLGGWRAGKDDQAAGFLVKPMHGTHLAAAEQSRQQIGQRPRQIAFASRSKLRRLMRMPHCRQVRRPVHDNDLGIGIADNRSIRSAICGAHGFANSESAILSGLCTSVISASMSFLPSWKATTFIGRLMPPTSLKSLKYSSCGTS